MYGYFKVSSLIHYLGEVQTAFILGKSVYLANSFDVIWYYTTRNCWGEINTISKQAELKQNI